MKKTNGKKEARKQEFFVMHPAPVRGKEKKQLTRDEEFKILLLVLDKFLWLGFGIMALGLFQLFNSSSINGLYLMLAGAVVLVIFMVLLLREYELSK
jgi:hypothetical protein